MTDPSGSCPGPDAALFLHVPGKVLQIRCALESVDWVDCEWALPDPPESNPPPSSQLKREHVISSSPAFKTEVHTTNTLSSQAFGITLNYTVGILESPACKEQTVGLLSLHNHVNQFLIINIFIYWYQYRYTGDISIISSVSQENPEKCNAQIRFAVNIINSFFSSLILLWYMN